MVLPPSGLTDPSYLDVQWTDPGAAGLDETSFGTANVTISGVTVDRIENLGGGRVRYLYGDDGHHLQNGLIDVVLVGGQVSDRAGNPNATQTASFWFGNTPPVIHDGDLVLSAGSIAEGSPVSLQGAFTDPDVGQAHSVLIHWGDGSPDSTLALDPGVLAFGPVSHTYADADLSGTPAGVYAITVTVTDIANASASAGTHVLVTNVAPTVDPGPGSTINEGATFLSSGSFTDPGADTWTATVNYGDGSGDQVLALNADHTFTLNHFYADNGTSTVTVTVTV
jgi:hypothetical protein